MTELEAAAFLNDLFVAFPQTREWLVKSEEPAATRDIWIRTVTRCELRDASVVLDDLIAGDLEMPAAYSRDQTPQIIRRYCRSLANDRSEQERTKCYQQMARRESDLDAREHARAYFAMHWLLDHGDRPVEEVDRVVEWTRGGELPEFMEFAFKDQQATTGEANIAKS